MVEDQNKIDVNFFQLVVSLQMAAMQNMGKIASPITGKIERNLDQAKVSIDMLSMLSGKMEGNLTDEEKDLLDRALYELRMNFVDESKKEDVEEKKTGTDNDNEGHEAEPTGKDVPGQNKSDDQPKSENKE